MCIFFGGDLAELGITFFQWCPFSPVRAQIGQELVRLITLIEKKINVIFFLLLALLLPIGNFKNPYREFPIGILFEKKTN